MNLQEEFHTSEESYKELITKCEEVMKQEEIRIRTKVSTKRLLLISSPLLINLFYIIFCWMINLHRGLLLIGLILVNLSFFLLFPAWVSCWSFLTKQTFEEVEDKITQWFWE